MLLGLFPLSTGCHSFLSLCFQDVLFAFSFPGFDCVVSTDTMGVPGSLMTPQWKNVLVPHLVLSDSTPAEG